jgi:hypothetical protein
MCFRNPISCEQLLASARSLIERSQALRRHGEPPRSRTHTQLLKCADEGKPSRAEASRACPQCRESLEWIERGRLLGLEYDYYRWCGNGCGLYCYECQSGNWIRLA